ncbi:hypothetical protein NSED_04790 [Candidatus Nitrosopumilus sediminis]|uniref:Uncharacterized protein n=2 Tax=Candidatus Nitrosopumilus sediminis TaxID=1229909 RepID=K0BCD2_9ARCH|nr:hypothetical protein NSED_04790 [Candidatus Nitrosopumilus sediminis]
MSKNDPKLTQLEKYDVDANIDEVQSDDEISVFTYKFTALSNPKNVRLSIAGTAKISGDTMERDEILENDDEGIPKILTVIYQELFPTFFLLSKTLNVSCPPHKIGQMGAGVDNELSEEVAVENESIDVPVEAESETDSVENPDMTQPNV